MALVIAVATTKGGAGKTTMAILLAGEFAQSGLQVKILDTDPQGSAVQWAEKSKVNGTELSGIVVDVPGVDENALAEQLNNDAGADVFIVDLQGTANQALAIAVSNADLVLIPTQGSLLDATQALKVVQFLKAIAGKGLQTPYRIVLNRVSGIETRTRAFVEAVQFLIERKLNMTTTYIRDRPLYRHMTNGHGTLYDLDETDAVMSARGNAHDLVAELIDVIKQHRQEAADAGR
ncbi:ParA family protein [Rhizobium sp. VS19-DR104.2]|uniref:ParA family protein n=1 Tax=unclassified Rhizobium TaxID=2613769 RepID=UPI001CC688A5|nr:MULTISPECIES: ParA family protein [unclassified Rhizobium]MBZ5762271.1 ParA family protein [Rhizobium sp. VS19-DR96]MBZ5768287.1 ParA family protein [Rhizobium sp. VS19-DR129.2]MBZ5775841.1 ParA family protein [Rhizobium sp. VS19-DRK62.2]MBZ5787138.1 ParA family protein [Rhizobium sp. VS19-DR121]MBZ5804213.1 ParA family protein [Rhizobium sp. VS19-DR181]